MECFKVYRNEIYGRIDPHFYRPSFIRFYNILQKSKFEIKTIREISERVTSGATPKSKGSAYATKEEGIPFIRSGDINEDKTINFDDILYIKSEIHNKLLKGSKLKKEDVLIAIVGATIGQVSIYDHEREANINQAIALVRLKEGINPEYVKAFLLSTLGQKQLNRIKRPVARANINLDEIGGIHIILPPLEPENKVVEFMGQLYQRQKQKETEAQQLIDSINEYVLEELSIKLPEVKDEMCYVVTADEVKNNRCDAYYYQPKFTLVESKLEAVDYPVFSIGELITDLSGGATPKVEGDFYTDIDGVFFLRVQNISMEGIILEDVKFIKREVHEGMLKRSQLNKNDLVYTITGRIGSVAVVPEGFEGNINQHSVRFHLKEKINNIVINPYYVAIFLNTELGNFLAIRKATGGTRPALDYHTLKSLIIPLPSEEIQDKITKEVKARMQKAEQLRKEAKEVLEKAKERVERIILGWEEI